MPEIEQRPFTAPLECDYLLERSAQSQGSITAVTLHGYGQTPDEMLELTRKMLGPNHWVAALRAPHPFALKPFTAGSAIGYNWGAPTADWERSKRLHHAMLMAALEDLKAVGAPPPILIGFSQPVSLNYRFVRAHPDAVAGVIGICGGVPKDWEELPLPSVKVPILNIVRSGDEFYSEQQLRESGTRLQSRSESSVDFHMLPGAHRFPSQADEIVADWLRHRLNA